MRPVPVAAAAQYFAWLGPQAEHIDAWATEYLHVLPRATDVDHPVVAWTKGTALTPFLAALEPDARAAFVADYAARVARGPQAFGGDPSRHVGVVPACKTLSHRRGTYRPRGRAPDRDPRHVTEHGRRRVDDVRPVHADRQTSETVSGAGRGRDVHLREKLAFTDGGHVHAEEELVRRHGSLAALPADRERRVERGEEHWQMIGGVAHTDVPADRAPVPHLDVTDRRRDFGEYRPRNVHLRRAHQLCVRDHRADLEHPLRREADRAQLVEIGQVDEHVRSSRTSLHHVHECLPARERACALVRREHRDRLLDRGRACVLDLAQEHVEIQSHGAVTCQAKADSPSDATTRAERDRFAARWGWFRAIIRTSAQCSTTM